MEMFFGNAFGLNRLPFLNHLTFFFHLVWGLHLSKVGWWWQLRRTWWPKLTWIRCFFCTADTFAVDGLTPREIKKNRDNMSQFDIIDRTRRLNQNQKKLFVLAKSYDSPLEFQTRKSFLLCTKIKSWTLHKVLSSSCNFIFHDFRESWKQEWHFLAIAIRARSYWKKDVPNTKSRRNVQHWKNEQKWTT